MDRGKLAGQVNRLPGRTGQETICCVRKEDRIVRGYIGVYIELLVSYQSATTGVLWKLIERYRRQNRVVACQG